MSAPLPLAKAPIRHARTLTATWAVRLIVRVLLSAILTWPLVWLGCGLRAELGVYFTSCGHNAYVWFLPAFVVAFAALTAVPALRLSRRSRSVNSTFKSRRRAGSA
jgi:hypothetical protein